MATPARFVSRPSLARVVCLEGFGPCVRGAGTGRGNLSWPAKDPGDVLDYVLDASPALFGVEGDGIVTLDIQVSPQTADGLIVDSSAVDGDRVVLWLSGGTAGQVYTVTLGLGTAGGRYLLRSVAISVQSLSQAASVVQSYLLDGSGAPLIDQNGLPILSD